MVGLGPVPASAATAPAGGAVACCSPCCPWCSRGLPGDWLLLLALLLVVAGLSDPASSGSGGLGVELAITSDAALRATSSRVAESGSKGTRADVYNGLFRLFVPW